MLHWLSPHTCCGLSGGASNIKECEKYFSDFVDFLRVGTEVVDFITIKVTYCLGNKYLKYVKNNFEIKKYQT
jgi:hypothetical protein